MSSTDATQAIKAAETAAKAAKTQREKAVTALKGVIAAKDKGAAAGPKKDAEDAASQAEIEYQKADGAAKSLTDAEHLVPARDYARQARAAWKHAEKAKTEANGVYETKPGEEPKAESSYVPVAVPLKEPGMLAQQVQALEVRLSSLESRPPSAVALNPISPPAASKGDE